MSDETPDRPDGEKPDPKPADKPKVPKFDQKETAKMFAASQFAYTLVGATLILGYFGHWIGGHMGGPWDVILMLLFGALGFCAEMYRMLKMFSPKDKSKDEKTKDDTKKDS